MKNPNQKIKNQYVIIHNKNQNKNFFNMISPKKLRKTKSNKFEENLMIRDYFINNNNINSTTKNRIIKKKKIRKENNIKYIKTENEEKNEIDKMENKKIKISKKINKNIIKNETNHINYNEIKKTQIIKSLNDSEGNDLEINT